MEKLGYALIGFVAVVWIIGMIAGMIVIMPYGLIGLIFIIGIGLFLVKAIKDRLASEEDDYYSKNVEQ